MLALILRIFVSCRAIPVKSRNGCFLLFISFTVLLFVIAWIEVSDSSWPFYSTSGRLPEAWKLSSVVPIPKDKEHDNYRPISLLSVTSKLLEHHFHY